VAPWPGRTTPNAGSLVLLVRPAFIQPGRPPTDGAVERVQRTILEECWRSSFARSLAPKIGGLERDLEAYLRCYHEERTHTGRLTAGSTHSKR